MTTDGDIQHSILLDSFSTWRGNKPLGTPLFVKIGRRVTYTACTRPKTKKQACPKPQNGLRYYILSELLTDTDSLAFGVRLDCANNNNKKHMAVGYWQDTQNNIELTACGKTMIITKDAKVSVYTITGTKNELINTVEWKLIGGVIRVCINGYKIDVDLYLDKNKTFPVIICGPDLTTGAVEFLNTVIPPNLNVEYLIQENKQWTTSQILTGLGLAVGVIFASVAVAHYFLPNVVSYDPITELSNVYTTAAQTATNAISSVSKSSQAAVEQLQLITTQAIKMAESGQLHIQRAQEMLDKAVKSGNNIEIKKATNSLKYVRNAVSPLIKRADKASAALANAAIGSISPTIVGLGVTTMVGATAYTIINIKTIIKKIWEHTTPTKVTILSIVCRLMYEWATVEHLQGAYTLYVNLTGNDVVTANLQTIYILFTTILTKITSHSAPIVNSAIATIFEFAASWVVCATGAAGVAGGGAITTVLYNFMPYIMQLFNYFVNSSSEITVGLFNLMANKFPDFMFEISAVAIKLGMVKTEILFTVGTNMSMYPAHMAPLLLQLFFKLAWQSLSKLGKFAKLMVYEKKTHTNKT